MQKIVQQQSLGQLSVVGGINFKIIKMRAKLFILALLALSVFQVYAQGGEEITLIVSADGITKDEATKVALRSAIEQAYGTFVSSNTELLNDELIKDEVITLSFGNVKSFKELSSEMLPDGKVFTTIQATVSIPQLVSYAKSKGAEVEFAGATFAMNLKMEELNKKNEERAFANMFKVMEELYKVGFDYTINITTPKVNGETIANIEIVPNENAKAAYVLYNSTMESLSLKPESVKNYEQMGMDVFTIGDTTNINAFFSQLDATPRGYHFRSANTLAMFSVFFNLTLPRVILNIVIECETQKSQLSIIATGAISGKYAGRDRNLILESACKKRVFEKYMNYTNNGMDGKCHEIFNYDIPARHVSSPIFLSYYSFRRTLYADDSKRGYIDKIIDGYSPCFFVYDEEHRDGHCGYVVNIPQPNLQLPYQNIKLRMVIPVDDLMKISKFIVRNGKD